LSVSKTTRLCPEYLPEKRFAKKKCFEGTGAMDEKTILLNEIFDHRLRRSDHPRNNPPEDTRDGVWFMTGK